MAGVVLRDPTIHLRMLTHHELTGEADTEVLTAEDNGFEPGDAVMFLSLTGGTGLTTDTIYYVLTTPDADDFTVSETPDGPTAEFSTDVTAGTVCRVLDLTPHIRGANIDRASDTMDARTFTHTRATRMGGGQDTITLTLLWSPELYTLLQPDLRRIGDLFLEPVAGGKHYECKTRYHRVPSGRYEVGQTVEVEMPLAVLSDLKWEAS